MNVVFFLIVLISFLIAGYRQLTVIPPVPDAGQPMAELAAGMIDTAADSVTLALGLVGAMALFLGLMKVAEAGGLLTIIAKLLRPLMVRLFPEVHFVDLRGPLSTASRRLPLVAEDDLEPRVLI